MKKKIIICLIAIIVILIGIYAYLSYSGNKYKIEKTEDTHETEVTSNIVTDSDNLEISDLTTDEAINEIIPELEDLSNTKNSYTFRIDEENSKELDSITLIKNDTKYVTITPNKKNATLYGSLKEDGEDIRTNTFGVLSKKNNIYISGNLNNQDYTENDIAEIFNIYKSADQKLPDQSYYRYYDWGDIKEFEYKGIEGVYNKCIKASSESVVKINLPFMTSYHIVFNINGKALWMNVQVYTNTSFGQMDIKDILDYMLEIKEA